MVCKKCNLIEGNKFNGLTYGNPDSGFIIVRPFPTKMECVTNSFDTKQNNILLKLLDFVNLNNNSYYITNIVHCYPNTQITKKHIDICSFNNDIIKDKQKVIMALGISSFSTLTGIQNKTLDIEYYIKNNISFNFGNTIVYPNYSIQSIIYNEDMFNDFIIQLNNIIDAVRINVNINFGI